MIVHIEANIPLEVTEIWPDGNEPENATALQAAEEIAKYIRGNGFARFVSEWNLENNIRVSVDSEHAWSRVMPQPIHWEQKA